jgi:hypothetical protein
VEFVNSEYKKGCVNLYIALKADTRYGV